MAQENKQLETRTLPIRELRINRSDGGSVIEGHAAVFDSWSETLGGFFPFKEKVARGAFSKSIEGDDIRALFNHDPNYVLGRNKAGTLTLFEDEKGLGVRINPPDTQWARDLQVSIDRGDINQMSFGFMVEEDDWRSEDGYDIRELRKVKLYDVSPVTYPAYTQTDVGVRGMQSYEKYKAEIRSKQEESDAAVKAAKDKQRLLNLKRKFKTL